MNITQCAKLSHLLIPMRGEKNFNLFVASIASSSASTLLAVVSLPALLHLIYSNPFFKNNVNIFFIVNILFSSLTQLSRLFIISCKEECGVVAKMAGFGFDFSNQFVLYSIIMFAGDSVVAALTDEKAVRDLVKGSLLVLQFCISLVYGLVLKETDPVMEKPFFYLYSATLLLASLTFAWHYWRRTEIAIVIIEDEDSGPQFEMPSNQGETDLTSPIESQFEMTEIKIDVPDEMKRDTNIWKKLRCLRRKVSAQICLAFTIINSLTYTMENFASSGYLTPRDVLLVQMINSTGPLLMMGTLICILMKWEAVFYGSGEEDEVMDDEGVLDEDVHTDVVDKMAIVG